MAGIALDSLTLEQKKYEARAMRFDHKQVEIAKLLHVPARTVREWMIGMKIPPLSQFRTVELSTDETCHCPVAASDPRTDALCRRTATCFWCGKPPARSTRLQAVISAEEA